MKQTPETVILIDCGYDGIQKLARAVRDKQIYTMVIPCTAPAERVLAENPVGLVFVSGGNDARMADAQAKFAGVSLPKFAAADLNDADKVIDFCVKECKCSGNWKMEDFIEEAVADIRAQVGDQTVVLGLSGGVDSSVAAALIHRAIGDRLSCVFVNHGLLRKNEAEMVQEIFARNFKMSMSCTCCNNNSL